MGWREDLVVNLNRLWPDVVETSGWKSRGNGSSWAVNGAPVATMNHHLVVPATQQYEPISRDMAISGYTGLPGPICNTMIAADGTIYLIAGNPANHAGMGRSEVRDRVMSNRAPLGNAADVYGSGDNWGSGNTHYFGMEAQHPGDLSMWPDIQIRAIYAWNAAVLSTLGFPAERAIHHREHSPRKKDMSWSGDLRAGVRLTMNGTIQPPVIVQPNPSWLGRLLRK